MRERACERERERDREREEAREKERRRRRVEPHKQNILLRFKHEIHVLL
jgi:hypothetical protein